MQGYLAGYPVLDRLFNNLVNMFCPIRVFCPICLWAAASPVRVYLYGQPIRVLATHMHMG